VIPLKKIKTEADIESSQQPAKKNKWQEAIDENVTLFNDQIHAVPLQVRDLQKLLLNKDD
jgi:hypothetical protein